MSVVLFGSGPARQAAHSSARAAAFAAVFAATVVLLPVSNAWGRGPSPGAAFDATVALGTLPKEARETHGRILAGGPFPFEKDGTVFGNRERLLPRQARGFYREYTVSTPGVPHRGGRRIVCGGRQPTAPQACYFTADHYASFRRIEP